MGYNTDFDGVLKFKDGITGIELNHLRQFLGELTSDHPDWFIHTQSGRKDDERFYIKIKIADDYSGIEWDGCENCYQMVDQVNTIIHNMKKKYPGFELEGKLLAQGEDIDDRWELHIENGIAVEKKIVVKGERITCPSCDTEFVIEEKVTEEKNKQKYLYIFEDNSMFIKTSMASEDLHSVYEGILTIIDLNELKDLRVQISDDKNVSLMWEKI